MNVAEHEERVVAGSSTNRQVRVVSPTTSLIQQNCDEIIKSTNQQIISWLTRSLQFEAMVKCFKHANEHVEIVEEVFGEA